MTAIDAVAMVVRVPSHYAPTKAGIEAGKRDYCEWPLGRTTAEAEELTALARAKGLVTAVGLQTRLNPVFMYMTELVGAGYVGEISRSCVCPTSQAADMQVLLRWRQSEVLSRPAFRRA